MISSLNNLFYTGLKYLYDFNNIRLYKNFILLVFLHNDDKLPNNLFYFLKYQEKNDHFDQLDLFLPTILNNLICSYIFPKIIIPSSM
jgi:hypothetical protein